MCHVNIPSTLKIGVSIFWIALNKDVTNIKHNATAVGSTIHK